MELGDTAWYEVFGALRFATTVVLLMKRWVGHGALPDDHTIWRDNPAIEVLGHLFSEVSR